MIFFPNSHDRVMATTLVNEILQEKTNYLSRKSILNLAIKSAKQLDSHKHKINPNYFLGTRNTHLEFRKSFEKFKWAIGEILKETTVDFINFLKTKKELQYIKQLKRFYHSFINLNLFELPKFIENFPFKQLNIFLIKLKQYNYKYYTTQVLNSLPI